MYIILNFVFKQEYMYIILNFVFKQEYMNIIIFKLNKYPKNWSINKFNILIYSIQL
jgi:hypothetical protein